MYSNKLISDILIYINNNINSKITIEDLENRFFYNRFYIMKLFKKEINMTIIDYINSIRIYNSIKYIKENDTLLNVSLNSGFSSLEYYSETFKRITLVNAKDVKDYLNNKKYMSNKKIDKINSALINLYEINNIKDKYISNLKPIKQPVKKLSIFK